MPGDDAHLLQSVGFTFSFGHLELLMRVQKDYKKLTMQFHFQPQTVLVPV